jgi:hypothetical protein
MVQDGQAQGTFPFVGSFLGNIANGEHSRAWNHPSHCPDSASRRCASHMALQQRLGLWTLRRTRDGVGRAPGTRTYRTRLTRRNGWRWPD